MAGYYEGIAAGNKITAKDMINALDTKEDVGKSGSFHLGWTESIWIGDDIKIEGFKYGARISNIMKTPNGEGQFYPSLVGWAVPYNNSISSFEEIGEFTLANFETCYMYFLRAHSKTGRLVFITLYLDAHIGVSGYYNRHFW